MKNTLLFLLVFCAAFFLSCSKESLDIDPAKTHLDYVGAQQVESHTNFAFIVSSDYEQRLLVKLEAITVFNEKIVSEQFALTKGEKKEIILQKKGISTFDHYIKSYRLIRHKIEDLPLKNRSYTANPVSPVYNSKERTPIKSNTDFTTR